MQIHNAAEWEFVKFISTQLYNKTMRTKGDALVNKIEDSITKINSLISISYMENDYSEMVIAIGGDLEKFLKGTVLNIANKKFYDLIEELKNHGIAQSYVDFLHDFRLCYNGYKHNPIYTRTIFEVKTYFINIKGAVNEIIANSIGLVSQPYQSRSKRTVWFAGWDDYVGGMTECGVFIPDYDIDMPIESDHFNLHFRGWNAIVEKFTGSNELFMGKEHVSARAFNFWKFESDFVNAGAFVGDVSEFVRELCKHIAKNENDLIPFLKRNHDSYSVYCSAVFSIFDVLREDSWTSQQNLKDEILLRMAYDYGIDLNSPHLAIIDYFDYVTVTLYRDQLKNTNEILWLDEANYSAKKIGEISQKLSIGFDRNYNILTKIK